MFAKVPEEEVAAEGPLVRTRLYVVCIHIYIYICVYIYTYTYIYIHIYTYLHAHTYAYVCINIKIRVYVYSEYFPKGLQLFSSWSLLEAGQCHYPPGLSLPARGSSGRSGTALDPDHKLLVVGNSKPSLTSSFQNAVVSLGILCTLVLYYDHKELSMIIVLLQV